MKSHLPLINPKYGGNVRHDLKTMPLINQVFFYLYLEGRGPKIGPRGLLKPLFPGSRWAVVYAARSFTTQGTCLVQCLLLLLLSIRLFFTICDAFIQKNVLKNENRFN